MCNIVGLKLEKGGEQLRRKEVKALVKKLRKRHAHMLGKERPANITGKCHKNKGYYVGEGTCLIYRFIDPTHKPRFCSPKCRSEEIVKQLNWLFRQKGGDVVAYWKEAAKEKGDKRVMEGKGRRKRKAT